MEPAPRCIELAHHACTLAEVFLTCAAHALSTEAEEIMGLLLGRLHEAPDGSKQATIWMALPQIRTDRRKVLAAEGSRGTPAAPAPRASSPAAAAAPRPAGQQTPQAAGSQHTPPAAAVTWGALRPPARRTEWRRAPSRWRQHPPLQSTPAS